MSVSQQPQGRDDQQVAVVVAGWGATLRLAVLYFVRRVLPAALALVGYLIFR